MEQKNLYPFDLSAEQKMLRLLEWDNAELVTQLETDHFFSPLHQKVFATMQKLFTRLRKFDSLTILRELKDDNSYKDGSLIKIFNDDYITKSYWDSLFTILDNLRLRRELVRYAQKIIKDAGENEDGELIHSLAKKSVNQIHVRKTETIYPVRKVMLDVLDEFESKKEPFNGYFTGFYDLDHLITGFKFGNFDIVAARPSHGKTSFAINCLIAAMRQNVKVLFLSLEMSKEEIVQQIMCIIGKMKNSDIDTKNPDWDKLTLCCNRISNFNAWIDDESYTPEAIHNSITTAFNQNGIQAVILDYIQLVKYRQNYQLKLTELMGTFAKDQARLAKSLEIHYMALSQLNRDSEKRDSGRPRSADLKDSGGLEEAAYKILMLFNPFVHDPEENKQGALEVLVTKNKRGGLGTVKLGFSDTTEIYNLRKGEV